MIQVLLARLGAVEMRHWVAVAGSAVLHLGVWLGLSGVVPAPESVPPPMTFEVKLEPPPKSKPKAVAKSTPVKKQPSRQVKKDKPKPKPREPHTLEAQWRDEAKPAENIPTVSLPDARAIGVEVTGPAAEVKPALAKAAAMKPEQSLDKTVSQAAGAGQSESGGGGASAQSQEPGLTLAAASSLGQARTGVVASGAQGSEARAGSAVTAGKPGGESLVASAAGGSGLNRAVGGAGGEAAHGGDLSQQNAGGIASGEPSGLRLALTGMLSSLAPMPAGGAHLAAGQLDGSAGSAAAMGQGTQQRYASAAAGKPVGIAVAGATQAGTGGGDAASGSPSAARGGGGAGGELSGAVIAAPQVVTKPGPGGATEAGAVANAPMAASVAALAQAGQGGFAQSKAASGHAPVAGKTGPGAAEAGTAANAPMAASVVTLAQAGQGGFAQSGAASGHAPVAGKTGPGAADTGSRQGLTATGAAGSGKLGQVGQAGSKVDPIFLARERGRARQADAGGAGAVAGDKAGPGRGNLAVATRGTGQGMADTKATAGGMTVEVATGTGRGAGSGGGAGSWGWLVNARGSGNALTGKTGGGALSSGKPTAAALTPGEPGSAPGLAMTMPVVPAVLEMRGEGGRETYRGKSGTGGGDGGMQGGATGLAASRDAQAAALSSQGKAKTLAAAPVRDGGLGGSGERLAAVGKLDQIRVEPVRQVRADSQARTLDVLAPSTYCPLPFHATPDNRPKPAESDVVEKPSYAGGNMNFTFPMRAWAYGHQGRAIVRVEVRADGTPGRMWIKQSSGSGILDTDAQEQLGKTRFQPARKNGQPVSAWIDVPVDYRLHAETKP